jgi:chemotaxis methyl-accepting protein methylase
MEIKLRDEDIFNLAEKLIGVGKEEKFKKQILIRNVTNRMIKTKKATLDEYLQFADRDKSEYQKLISSLTIHTTNWFREETHFTHLREEVIKKVSEFDIHNPFKVLCAASSTGEEVYSLSMMLETIKKEYPTFEFKVNGFDIDPVSIQKAKASIYSMKKIEEIDKKYHSFIEKGMGDNHGSFRIIEEIKSKCNFNVGNILETHKIIHHQYHQIFCRNCLIYFSPDKVEKILVSLMGHLTDTGILTLGVSEAIFDPKLLGLQMVFPSSYKKII